MSTAADSAAALNKDHFNEKKHAHQYDNEISFKMGRVIVNNLLAYTHPALVPLQGLDQPISGATVEPISTKGAGIREHDSASNSDEKTVNPFWKRARVLDFAAGTGIISQYLLPHIDTVVGVDISTEMIKLYNQKPEKLGVSASAMSGYAVDLFEPRETWSDDVQKAVGSGFDAAVCSLAYHHIDDTTRASSVLLGALKPGGWLFVADFSKATGKDSSAQKPSSSHGKGDVDSGVVPHKGGFTPAELENSLTTAGFVNVSAQTAFIIDIWANDEVLKFFKGANSNDDEGNDTVRFGIPIHGKRENETTGKTEYLMKLNMLLAVGQKAA